MAADALATLRGARTDGAGGGVLSEIDDDGVAVGEVGYSDPSQKPLSFTETAGAGARGISTTPGYSTQAARFWVTVHRLISAHTVSSC